MSAESATDAGALVASAPVTAAAVERPASDAEGTDRCLLDMMEMSITTTAACSHRTGANTLDGALAGMLTPGSMLVLAGAAESGKTALAVQIVREAHNAGQHVAVAAHDRDPFAWPRRLAALDGIPGGDAAVIAHMRREYPRLRMSPDSLEQVAKHLPATGGVLVLDSVQTCRMADGAARELTPRTEAVMRILASEQTQHRRWVIATSEVAKLQTTGIFAPRGSVAISHAADVLLVLRGRGRSDARRIKATVTKPSGPAVELRIGAGGAVLDNDSAADDSGDIPGVTASAQRPSKSDADLVSRVHAMRAEGMNAGAIGKALRKRKRWVLDVLAGSGPGSRFPVPPSLLPTPGTGNREPGES